MWRPYTKTMTSWREPRLGRTRETDRNSQLSACDIRLNMRANGFRSSKYGAVLSHIHITNIRKIRQKNLLLWVSCEKNHWIHTKWQISCKIFLIISCVSHFARRCINNNNYNSLWQGLTHYWNCDIDIFKRRYFIISSQVPKTRLPYISQRVIGY